MPSIPSLRCGAPTASIRAANILRFSDVMAVLVKTFPSGTMSVGTAPISSANSRFATSHGIVCRQQMALRRFQEPATRGVTKDPDERDAVTQDRQDHDAARRDDAIVKPKPAAGKRHGIANDVADIDVISEQADAQVVGTPACCGALRAGIPLRFLDLIGLKQNLDRTIGLVLKQRGVGGAECSIALQHVFVIIGWHGCLGTEKFGLEAAVCQEIIDHVEGPGSPRRWFSCGHFKEMPHFVN